MVRLTEDYNITQYIRNKYHKNFIRYILHIYAYEVLKRLLEYDKKLSKKKAYEILGVEGRSMRNQDLRARKGGEIENA